MDVGGSSFGDRKIGADRWSGAGQRVALEAGWGWESGFYLAQKSMVVIFAALTELPNWGIQSTVLFLERQFIKINYQPAEQGFQKPEPAPAGAKGGRGDQGEEPRQQAGFQKIRVQPWKKSRRF